MTHPYYCKECGGAAVVVDGEVRRTCSHVDSTIIAERTCSLYGEGGVTPGRAPGWFDSILRKLAGK